MESSQQRLTRLYKQFINSLSKEALDVVARIPVDRLLFTDAPSERYYLYDGLSKNNLICREIFSQVCYLNLRYDYGNEFDAILEHCHRNIRDAICKSKTTAEKAILYAQNFKCSPFNNIINKYSKQGIQIACRKLFDYYLDRNSFYTKQNELYQWHLRHLNEKDDMKIDANENDIKKSTLNSNIKSIQVKEKNLEYNELCSEHYLYDEKHSFFTPIVIDPSTSILISESLQGTQHFSLNRKFFSDIIYYGDTDYNGPIVYRRPYRYQWYGRNGISAKIAMQVYGIAVRCIDIYDLEYECMLSVEGEDNRYLLCAVSESDLEDWLYHRSDKFNFIYKTSVYLSDFQNMDIIEKINTLTSFYFIDDFIYDYTFISIEEAWRKITKCRLKCNDSEYDWIELSEDGRKKFLYDRITCNDNDAYQLMFDTCEIDYKYPENKFTIYYTIHSEYSIYVFLDILVSYTNGKKYCIEHTPVKMLKDSMNFFEGKTIIRQYNGYLWDIESIVLNLFIE